MNEKKMKQLITTAVISLVTISGAYGKGSKASTKSSKSPKSSKAICIEDSSLSLSSSSLSRSSKSGKSSKSAKAETETVCEPCAAGEVFGDPCETDIGYCEFDIISPDEQPVCTGKKCTPKCSELEPRCGSCAVGELFSSVTCPTDQGPFCEFVFSVDSAPTCVSSECVPPGPDFDCGPCKDLSVCPNVDGFCELQVSTSECVQCDPDTGCPNFSPNDSCFDYAGASGRRLEMSHEDREWGFKKLVLGLGL